MSTLFIKDDVSRFSDNTASVVSIFQFADMHCVDYATVIGDHWVGTGIIGFGKFL